MKFEVGVDRESGKEVVHVKSGPLLDYYLWLSPEYEYVKNGPRYTLSFGFDILGMGDDAKMVSEEIFQKALTEIYKAVILRNLD